MLAGERDGGRTTPKPNRRHVEVADGLERCPLVIAECPKVGIGAHALQVARPLAKPLDEIHPVARMKIVGLHVRQDLVEVERRMPATKRVAPDRVGLDEDIGNIGDHVLEVGLAARCRAPHQAKVGVVLEGVFPLDAVHQTLGLGVGQVRVV